MSVGLLAAVEGRRLVQDTVQIVRETGFQPGIVRTLQASKAAAETARDVLIELNNYRRTGASVAQVGRRRRRRSFQHAMEVGPRFRSNP